MLKIILWVESNIRIGDLADALTNLKNTHGNLHIVGMVAPEGVTLSTIPKIEQEEMKKLKYDIVLIANETASLPQIIKKTAYLKIPLYKFVLARTACIPNFTVDKYKKLLRSSLSILSMNCFGVFCYHRFGFPFLTPTINMFAATEEDFLKFLEDPKKNVNAEPILQGMGHNDNLDIDYPIFKIGDCVWHFNHYDDVEFAKEKWIERSKRINWKNILPVMYTENPEILKRFDRLPFSKKVCFINFETNLKSGFFVDCSKYKKSEFWEVVNAIAMGKINVYDMWDMLLCGKKTLLSEN